MENIQIFTSLTTKLYEIPFNVLFDNSLSLLGYNVVGDQLPQPRR